MTTCADPRYWYRSLPLLTVERLIEAVQTGAVSHPAAVELAIELRRASMYTWVGHDMSDEELAEWEAEQPDEEPLTEADLPPVADADGLRAYRLDPLVVDAALAVPPAPSGPVLAPEHLALLGALSEIHQGWRDGR